jgi:hypothetical protein
MPKLHHVSTKLFLRFKMKKTLFCGTMAALLLSSSGLSYADGPGKPGKLTPRRFITKAEQMKKLAALEDAARGKKLTAKQNFQSGKRRAAGSNSIASITYSDLGQSVNPFTILTAGRNCLSVNPSLNTVAFFRRGGVDDPAGIFDSPGNKLFYDLNTKGGVDGQWQLSRGPVFTDDAFLNDPRHTSGGGTSNFGTRYPQGGIWNPPGNTDTANAVAIGLGRVLDGSNGAWGGLGLGWQRLGSGSAIKQYLESSSDPLHFRTESMEVTANAVFTTEPIEDLASGGVDFTDKIAVYKITYDAALDTLLKTTVYLPFENEGGDYATSISNTAIAFGPDGLNGFVVVTAANNAFDSIATYIPYFSKTSDGGMTWTDLAPLRLNRKASDLPNADLEAFRDKMLGNKVYFDAEGNVVKAVPADTANYKLHNVDYLVNDIDVVVDKDYYAHVIMSVAISGFGDTLNATFPGGITYYPGFGSWNMHLYTNDPATMIKGELINQNVGLNGCWGDCAGSDNFSDANRPQAARSEDGSVLMFAWYDTDSAAHPQLTDDNNSNPDLWTQRIRVAEAGSFFYGPQTRNLTKGSDNDGLAALGNVAPRLLNGTGGDYILASTIATFADFDPATGTALMPTQHLFVGNINVPIAPDSFPVAANGNILGVGKIRKNLESTAISLYPNPSNGEFTAHFSSRQAGKADFRVYNQQGQLVASQEARVGKGDLNMNLNFTNLRPGMYLLQMSSGGQTGSRRFVIK